MQPDEIRKALKDALDEHRKEFWVDPETHYLQHKFIGDLMSAGKTVRKTSLVVIVSTVVGYVAKIIFIK